MKKRFSRLILTVFVVAMSGCSSVGYYAQSVKGQFEVLHKRRSIEKLIDDPATPTSLREKLQLAIEIREFAVSALDLPDNKSYKTYSDLGRPYVVWNVFATQTFSVKPFTWCFPIVGCVVYRGYFAESSAREFADSLNTAEYDVFVGGVPAYSTLGWFSDPLLNTIIHYDEIYLAGLIFHELAHQVVYIKNDSVFNESFATAVELEGVRRWLVTHGSEYQYQTYVQSQQREELVIDLILEYRSKLASLYQSDLSDELKRARKAETFSMLKKAYQTLKSQWPNYRSFDAWFAQPLNNAHLVVIASYHKWLPAFKQLLLQQNGDMELFFEVVRTLSRENEIDRERALNALL